MPGVVVEGSRPISDGDQPLRPIFSDGCVVHSLVRDYGSTECKRRRRRFWTDPAAGRLETPLHPCLTPLRTKLVSRPRKPRAGGTCVPILFSRRERCLQTCNQWAEIALLQVSERSCLCAWVGCSSRRAFWASAAPEVSTSELAGVLGETDANRKARALTLDPITTRNRQQPLSVAGYRRMVARAESGGCSQPRLAPHVRLQVSKWVETPGRSNAIWETGRLSRPPDRSRILEGLTLTIETALARLHHACNPAPRALRR